MLLVYLHRLELTPHHGYSRKHLCTKFEMYNCKCFPRHHYIQAIVVIHCIDPKNEFGFAQQKREKESTQKKGKKNYVLSTESKNLRVLRKNYRGCLN